MTTPEQKAEGYARIFDVDRQSFSEQEYTWAEKVWHVDKQRFTHFLAGWNARNEQVEKLVEALHRIGVVNWGWVNLVDANAELKLNTKIARAAMASYQEGEDTK